MNCPEPYSVDLQKLRVLFKFLLSKTKILFSLSFSLQETKTYKLIKKVYLDSGKTKRLYYE